MASFSSSGFSTSAFSEAAFDFGTLPLTPDVVLLGGGGPVRKRREEYSYQTPYAAYREDEYQRRLVAERAELRRIEDEIAEVERRKSAAQKRAKARLLAENAAKRLAALEASLQEEISELRNERARLMRLIDDDEAILLLILAMPFH